MIKYKLSCKDCSVNFDSWFSSSKEFEKVKRLKLLNCIKCGSKSILKSLMAPNIVKTHKKENLIENNKKLRIKNKIIEYQKFIKNNFQYVGDNFSYEARSIHYGKKEKRSIYGNASLKDVNELKEEGIETDIVPWVKDFDN
tara:strand:+ start:3542 stop:3964 length:423 start_codon:yes stop_codon:yes gene_type:complete